jgi:hypothetical protein
MGARRDPRQSRRANFAGPSAFTPAKLANVTLWLRADLGVTGGASPTAWADQSGAGNNLAGGGSSWSASSGPNSTAAITLPGNSTAGLSSGSATPVSGAGNFTIYVVHKLTDVSTALANAFQLGSGIPVKLGYSGATSRQFTLNANTQTGGADTTSYELWIYQATSVGTQSLRVNGASVSLSGNIAAFTPDGGVAFHISGTSGHDYSVAEVAISNSVPGANDVANFEAYALARYGL